MSEEGNFSKETIDQISKLALLNVSDEEKEQLSEQLDDINSSIINDIGSELEKLPEVLIWIKEAIEKI